MRDISRIDCVLALLGEVWKKQPDLRFGQLMINIFHDYGKDPWNVEEDEWMMILRSYLSNTNDKN